MSPRLLTGFCLASRQCEFRKRNRAAGLCWCGNTPAPNHLTCQECITASVERNRTLSKKLKIEALNIYGLECNCCKQNIIEFLVIDHIDSKLRTDKQNGISFYRQLKQDGWPSGFQTLCSNCNSAKSDTDHCPHVAMPILIDEQQRYRFRLRSTVLSAYGNKCVCCSEIEYAFLTIDHIAENGSDHLRSIGASSNMSFYRWLRDNNYPSGFQILCWNCNIAKHNYNICPHYI